MEISAVLSISLRRFWEEKVFWLLGTLAAVTSALSLPINQIFSPENLPILLPELASNLDELITSLLSLVVLLGINLLSIPLYLFGVLGIVAGVWKREQGVTARFSFGELLQTGLPFFWRVLGVRLTFVVGLIAVLIPTILVISMASIFTFGIVLLCLFPLIILFVPASYILYGLMELAETAVVIENLSIFEAITTAWRLFKANFWKMLVIALVIYLGAGIIAAVLVVPFNLPAYLPMFSDLLNNEIDKRSILLVSIAALCLLSPLYAFFQGALVALQRIIWAQTYLAINRPANPSAALVEIYDVG
ncbi:MAG: hypothetical protein N2117_00830 [Anaerolineales bacterium]|nr:hypothetical protein [Anaerolineales bacterium]MDW8279413.1 hypothetical protein [Anaerolineales bacterium]